MTDSTLATDVDTRAVGDDAPRLRLDPRIVAVWRVRELITAVILLGAVPSIANGLVAGIDRVPPLFLRAGRTLGARGLVSAWHILLPASLPGYVAGLKQGWAFSWRSLMAAEIIAKSPDLGLGLGQYLENARNNSDMASVLLGIIMILVVGIAIGAGTDVAIESAGLILASSDPRLVVSIISLSRAAYRKSLQNLWWAAGYNIAAIPLAAGALAWAGVSMPPAVAAVLMSVSTIVVAANAQLLRRLDLRPSSGSPAEVRASVDASSS